MLKNFNHRRIKCTIFESQNQIWHFVFDILYLIVYNSWAASSCGININMNKLISFLGYAIFVEGY